MHTLIARIGLRYVNPVVDDEIVIGNLCIFVEKTYIASYTYISIILRILILEK